MKLPFGDAFVLLLFLLPGFLAMQIYRARYPAKRLSQFEVIVWSVLHSFVVHLGIAGFALVLGRSDLDLLNHGTNSSIHPSTIAVLLGGGIVWGAVLVAFHWVRVKLPFLPSPDSLAIWPLAAGGSAEDELWVVARTKQGAVYLGWVEKYSFDPTAEDHDFLLRPAYLVDPDLNVERDLTKGGVYLNTRDVDSLEMIPGR